MMQQPLAQAKAALDSCACCGLFHLDLNLAGAIPQMLKVSLVENFHMTGGKKILILVGNKARIFNYFIKSSSILKIT